MMQRFLAWLAVLCLIIALGAFVLRKSSAWAAARSLEKPRVGPHPTRIPRPPNKIWHYGDKEFRRTMSTPAVDEDLIFISDLSGFLHCVDRATGKPYWVHDTFAEVWSSPMVADGKVFMCDEDGDVEVFEAGREKKLLAEMNMDNQVYSIPVASRGVLYISTRTHLFALETGAHSGERPPENSSDR